MDFDVSKTQSLAPGRCSATVRKWLQEQPGYAAELASSQPAALSHAYEARSRCFYVRGGRRLLPLKEGEVDRRRRRGEAERGDRWWRSAVWIVPPAGVGSRHLSRRLVPGNIQLQALRLELQLPGLNVEVIRLRHHLMRIHHVCRRPLQVHCRLLRDREVRGADRDVAQRPG